MQISNNTLCPCGSLIKYKKCCKVFHEKKVAKTALEVMKSRYSAFCIKDYMYIIKTTHPSNQDFTDNQKLWKSSILDFCKATTFENLKILLFEEEKEVSFVTFKVSLLQNNNDVSFTERSRFEKVNNIWLYHSGEFL